MKISTLIAAFLGFLSFALSATAATGLAANTYRTSTVTGSAQWQDSATGESKPLLADQSLPVGAIINTGEASSVVLVFSSGATAVIGEKSQVIVSKFQQELFGDEPAKNANDEPSVSDTELMLNKGTITSRVAKLRAQSNYVVKTPIGAAGVRGTIFQVVYDPVNKVLRVLTAEGKVVFTTKANLDIPVDGGKDITLYFDLDDTGRPRIIKTETGTLTRGQLIAIYRLFGLILDDKLLLRLNSNQPILSDDIP